ncbi:hypothetical protein B4Q13_25110, partial [Lacticaseibacillus rhamnosus]
NFPSPFRSWKDAFRHQSTTTAMYQEDGKWWPFGITWPKKSSTPGDDNLFAATADEFTTWSYIPETRGWMRTQLATGESQLEQLTRAAVTTGLTGLGKTLPGPPPRRGRKLV